MAYYSIGKLNSVPQRSPLMNLSIRQIAPKASCHELCLDVLTDVLPRARLFDILKQENALEERERKLNMCTTVYVLIAMSLLPSSR